MKTTDQMLQLAIIAKIRTHTIENPIKSREIQQMYGINDEKVRDIVRDARDTGHPIGSGDDGFYGCRTFNEWLPTRKNLENRALQILLRIKKVDLAFKDQQETLF